jgi:hypothetical protein
MKNGILFISAYRESIPIAWQLSRQGAWVDYFILDPAYKKCFDGMLPKISLYEMPAALKRCSTVVFDMNMESHHKPHEIAFLSHFGIPTSTPDIFGPVSEKLRKTHNVICGGRNMFKIEMDREYGFALARKCGFDIPPFESFSSLQTGVKFLQGPGKDKRWYFKPFANQGGIDMTYGDSFPGDLADVMQTKMPEKFKTDKVNYLLQEKVDGVEVSTEIWFCKGVPKLPFQTLEQKKLMDGDLSCATGSQSNIVYPIGLDHPIAMLMANKVLLDFIGPDFTGTLDANAIVTENGKIFFLEWTSRMGWSSTYLDMCFIPDGQLPVFYQKDFNVTLKDGFCSSQLVSLYPYPNENGKDLSGWAKNNLIDHKPWKVPGFWWQDVYMAEDGNLRTCGVDGIVGVMTNHADTIDASIDGLYKKLGNLKISGNTQYRTKYDMMELAKRYNKLKAWGIT